MFRTAQVPSGREGGRDRAGTTTPSPIPKTLSMVGDKAQPIEPRRSHYPSLRWRVRVYFLRAGR
jgi:hypothetical protein